MWNVSYVEVQFIQASKQTLSKENTLKIGTAMFAKSNYSFVSDKFI